MPERNIHVTVECYVRKDNKYLMLHRNPTKKIMPNVWMAPGGKREFNEGLFECARREIKEETGLEIKNLKMLSTGNVYLKDLDSELFFTFVEAEFASGEVHNAPEDGELKWLTLKEILQLDNLLAELKYVLPIILGDNPRFVSYTAVYESGNDMTEFNFENPN